MFQALIHTLEADLQQWLPDSLATLQQPALVQPVHDTLFTCHDIHLDVLRCDLLHPVISGNKWFKLKFNLALARRQGCTVLASFGGAWSNHLHALAYCAQALGMRSNGYVRGDELDAAANSMLRDAQGWGMQLHFVSRHQYRTGQVDIEPGAWRIPEGGNNWPGLLGSMTMMPLALASRYDVIVLAWGTGCSALGVWLSVPDTTTVWAVSTLKGAWQQAALAQRLAGFSHLKSGGLALLTDYHQGGYGRVNPALLSFIREFGDNHNLPLDPVYSGKAMWGLCERIRQRSLPAGSRVLFVHTGGLQGARGFQSSSG